MLPNFVVRVDHHIHHERPSLAFVIGPVSEQGLGPLQQRGVLMSVLSATQKTRLSIAPVDRRGNPASVDGVPTWSTSDPNLLSVTPAAGLLLFGRVRGDAERHRLTGDHLDVEHAADGLDAGAEIRVGRHIDLRRADGPDSGDLGAEAVTSPAGEGVIAPVAPGTVRQLTRSADTRSQQGSMGSDRTRKRAERRTASGENKMLAEWFWTDRWMGSSAFLLPIEHRGLYREMLTQAWRRGARLPVDHEQIRRAVGCTEAEWQRCWPAIARFWSVEGDWLVNETQRQIYRDAQARAEQAHKRGVAGARARAQALREQRAREAKGGAEADA